MAKKKQKNLHSNAKNQKTPMPSQKSAANNKSAPAGKRGARSAKPIGESKQMSKNKKRFQRHFRKFHDKTTTAHPQYVFGDDGKCYEVLGVTSSPETNGVLNVQLAVNPEPGNKNTAYIRTKPTKIKKGVQNKKLPNWKLANVDKPKVNEIIENAEKKPCKKARQKK